MSRRGIFTIKLAWENDLDSFVEMYTSFYNELRKKQGLTPMESSSYRKEAIAILSKDKVFIGFLNNKAVAFIRVTDRNGVFWIEELFVEKQYRGMGIGKSLVDAAEAYVKQHSNSTYIMVLPQDREAINFWLKMGYNILNTIELVKFLDKKEREHHILPVLGIPYRIHKWVDEQYSSLEREYLEVVGKFFESGGTQEEFLRIVVRALKSKIET